MATVACASSSRVCPSTSTRLKNNRSLGFSLRSLSLVAATSFASATKKKSLAVKCTQETPDLSLVPEKERWMFDIINSGGPDIWNNTWYPKAADHVNTEKTWYVVDATDLILGRLASTIAVYIRGKDLALYTPSVDMGAFVIVVNAEKVVVSGRKRAEKLYRRHSGRPSGMKVETFDQLQKRIPERIIEHAVHGMLPKGRLGRQLFNHLKVYRGPDHPHQAQKPIPLPLADKRIKMEKPSVYRR